MNNCKKTRNVQDDCIRVIALILMVTTHTNKQSLSPILLSLLPVITEYYGAAEPPVRCGESHLSGLTEPLRSL